MSEARSPAGQAVADLAAETSALRDGAGAFRSSRDVVAVRGPDAEEYLQGQVSQDIAVLAVGAAADALLLEPEGKGPIDVLRATLPAGTLSGAPKVRAMEIIDELEPTKRGVYGGVVGYIDFSGNLDTAIAIRTMVVTPDGRASVQAGAGIVADSDPRSEDEECANKAGALLVAVTAARRMGAARRAAGSVAAVGPQAEP